MMQSLEQKLNRTFRELKISNKQRHSIQTYVALIRNKDEATYEHSARVGLKGVEVARYTHVVDPKALFYSGLLHDVGKALTDYKSLKKIAGFDEKDMEELKKHPIDGYRLLKNIHDFSARILLFHHRYVGEGYPKNIPHSEINFCRGSESNILYYARILGLIDFYDAVTHRKNDKFNPGNPRLPEKEEAKKLILKNNPDQKYFINELYNKGIFQ
ncbi:HD domain-containing protein [Candidatus Woesearchaeota archaeon]|nr:HD domain-containing protein [Candidatus Woesearchaeota archaeon]